MPHNNQVMDNVILNIYDLLPESRSRQQSQSSSSSSSQPPAVISNLFTGLLAPMGFGTWVRIYIDILVSVLPVAALR